MERFGAYTRLDVQQRDRKRALAARVRAVAEYTDSHYRRAVATALRGTDGKPLAVLLDELTAVFPRLAAQPIEQFLLEGPRVDRLQLEAVLRTLVAAGKIEQFEVAGVTVYRLLPREA